MVFGWGKRKTEGSLKPSATFDDEPTLKITLLSSKKVLHEMWYVVRVHDVKAGSPTHVMRRFEDFEDLDRGLRQQVASKSNPDSSISSVPDLPGAGRVRGRRNSGLGVNMNPAATRTIEELQTYLDLIVKQVTNVRSEPVLLDFFKLPLKDSARKDWINMVSPREAANRTERIPDNFIANKAIAYLRKVLESAEDELNPRPRQACQDDVFKQDTKVMIVGLIDKPYHNETTARVIVWYPEKMQYRIRLEDGRPKRIGAENLRRVRDLAADTREARAGMQRLMDELDEQEHSSSDEDTLRVTPNMEARKNWQRLILLTVG